YSLGSWVGVVSASALGFFDQLLMTPLAGAEQLAFYAVAMGITNLVGTVAVSIRAVVFSTESAEADWPRIAQSARLSLWVTTAFAAVVAMTCPVVLPAL